MLGHPRLPSRHHLSRKSPRCRPARSSRPRPKCRREGIKVKPEVMIPLVGFKKELDLRSKIVHRVAARSHGGEEMKFNYLVGTMIEVPRGAAHRRRDRADRRVLQLRHQRSDPDRARHEPRRLRLIPAALHRAGNRRRNPFATIDQDGVGQTDARSHVEKGRSAAEHQARHLRRTRRRSATA